MSADAPTLRRLTVAASTGPRRTRLIAPRSLLRIALPLFIVVAWQLVGAWGLVSPRVLPTPGSVAEGFLELYRGGDLQSALPTSLGRAAIGFVIGVGIGLIAGIANGLFRICEEVLDSTLQMVRLVPFIAVVPLFIMWFGIGELPKVLLIVVACIFPVYLNTYSGVRHVDQKLIEAAQVFGLRKLEVIAEVILPQALPSILSGLRYAMGTSLLALIVAEQVNASSGIGYVIFTAQGSLRMDLIIVGVVIYAALGVGVDVVMRIAERIAMPWR